MLGVGTSGTLGGAIKTFLTQIRKTMAQMDADDIYSYLRPSAKSSFLSA